MAIAGWISIISGKNNRQTVNVRDHFLKNQAKQKFVIYFFLAVLAMGAGSRLLADDANQTAPIATPGDKLLARVSASDGVYEVTEKDRSWNFVGSIGEPLDKLKAGRGSDANGDYREISFAWMEGILPMSGTIRVYEANPVVVFSETCERATEMPPPPFPSFTNLPGDLHVFSFQQRTFAPPQFRANDCSTPWLLFDDATNAMVISPASHFMVASMSGDGHQEITSGLNEKLRHFPAGFSQETILVFGKGINRTWDLWGKSLRALRGVRPDNEADAVLRYFGYWTDNGAHYYYNYDLGKGYAGTLQSLVEHYREEHIPIRYLQLDSWWYYKSFRDADGKMGKTKAPDLPEGEWNRYGGLLEYKAHPALFPDGLEAFQSSIGLPLVTHNRWIDPASPYHQHYKISGVAAVDPKWWRDIARYLGDSGVTTYEQDWLDRIYKYSPAFSSTVDTAADFLDDMSRACAKEGMTMQYCMPYPCYYLQGSEYKNLTTIRTSDDRFCPPRYNNFLYDSRLAYSMGIWPWSDVFLSKETNNMLLATLSAGPVGIGDEIGTEDTNNIFQAVRADGVIVKPDAPAVPLDQTYMADARGTESPLLAGTFTDHGGYKTEYVFAFNRSKSQSNDLHFTPSEVDFVNPVCVYDYFSGIGHRLDSGDTFSATLAANGTSFYIIAPFGRSGIAFLGDKGKFVSNGKQRITSLEDKPDGLTVNVLFAPMENSVVLHGYAASKPRAMAQSGQAKVLKYEPATGYFEIAANPDLWIPPENRDGDPVRQMTVTITTD